MYQVKTFNAIAQKGLEEFDDEFQINCSDDPDAYLIRSVNLLKSDFPKKLKTIVRAGAGINNIPIELVTKKGIAVFNTPGSNANAVKELIVALMIDISRNIFEAHDYSMENTKADVSQRTEKDKTKFNGKELMGKKIAVIGLGNVGSLVANAALNLGMKVIGYDPYLSSDAAWRINNKVKRVDTIYQALSEADIVTVHVPKNQETTDLISTEEIKKMKKGVILFNYSRMGIVDNYSVVKAVDEKKISHYCTDFGEPLISNRKEVTITPHIGGSTIEAESKGAIQGADTIINYLKSGDTIHCANLPNIQIPFETARRITIIHQNIPNMVGQFSTKIANLNINIENMSNAARNLVAYTIIDVAAFDATKQKKLLESINAINGVYKIRIIKHQ